MPRVEQLPPRAAEIVTEIVLDMNEDFVLNESKEIRDNKIVNYLIRQLAILESEIEVLKDGLSQS